MGVRVVRGRRASGKGEAEERCGRVRGLVGWRAGWGRKPGLSVGRIGGQGASAVSSSVTVTADNCPGDATPFTPRLPLLPPTPTLLLLLTLLLPSLLPLLLLILTDPFTWTPPPRPSSRHNRPSDFD